MIQLAPGMRCFLHLEPVDFRNGIDGLAGLCRRRLQQNPLNGGVFVFINRRHTSMKLLVYDGQGFWLCQKRFSQGRIKHWPKKEEVLTAPMLQILLYDGNPHGCGIKPEWRPM